ncbi:MAG TPA: NAD-dependent deacylase [Clostridia bacterium]|nr:NAD-dependent deacylase [Clostridia bacterium]
MTEFTDRDPEEVPRIEEALKVWAESKRTVVLTGAGISTESGLVDFRSPQGLWKQVNPAQVASIWALEYSPEEFFRFYRERLDTMRHALPNKGHVALARLEAAGFVSTVVTQNIDGLHQKAGSRSVYEVHGDLRSAFCMGCRRRFPIDVILEGGSGVRLDGLIPRCKSCGGTVRPNVVLFGEGLPSDIFRAAQSEATLCDLFIAIGSSLEVGPVNSLVSIAKYHGAHVMIINREPTYMNNLADIFLQCSAGPVLSWISEKLTGAAPGESGRSAGELR